jgi:hypothetical protein
MLLRSIHLVGTVNNVLSDLPMADKMKTSGFTTVGEGMHSPLKCISCANSQCTTHSSEIPEKMSVPLTRKITLNRYSLALFGPITYAYAESLRRDKLIAMKNELLVDVDTVPCTPQSFIGFNMLSNWNPIYANNSRIPQSPRLKVLWPYILHSLTSSQQLVLLPYLPCTPRHTTTQP